MLEDAPVSQSDLFQYKDTRTVFEDLQSETRSQCLEKYRKNSSVGVARSRPANNFLQSNYTYSSEQKIDFLECLVPIVSRVAQSV